MTIKDYETGEPIIPSPCMHCTGESMVRHRTENRYMTSEELCMDAGVCTATIDWERVYGRE